MARVALVLVAGLLAAELHILPIDSAELRAAIEGVRDLWLRGGEDLPEGVRGIRAVREFILRHGQARMQNASDPRNDGVIVRDLAGYMNPERRLYRFTESGCEEACQGYNRRGVLEELQRLRLLHTDDGTRQQSRHTIAGFNQRPRLYAIKADILEYGGMDETNAG
jgi:hypothetical protein